MNFDHLFQHLNAFHSSSYYGTFYKPLINISFRTIGIILVYVHSKVPLFFHRLCRAFAMNYCHPSNTLWMDDTFEGNQMRLNNRTLQRDSIRPRRIQTQCGESNRDDHHWPHSYLPSQPPDLDQISRSKSSLIIVFIFIFKKFY